MEKQPEIDLTTLERIAANGSASFGVLTASLMQYNALLFAVFALVSRTDDRSTAMLGLYLPIAILALLLPLVSSVMLHKSLQRQADAEMARIFQKNPELFEEKSQSFKTKYSKPINSATESPVKQFHIQKAAVWMAIAHTLVLVGVICQGLA